MLSCWRATRDDYQQWLSTALAAGGCVRPVRLRGIVRDIDTSTGEVIRDLDTRDLPDQAIYVPCGDRRASVCPPCAETYRADTYQLIKAGLVGGKGMPESVATHPCVFATFTAPSFGPVHTRVVTPGGKIARCRPRRKASFCPHGRRISCGLVHFHAIFRLDGFDPLHPDRTIPPHPAMTAEVLAEAIRQAAAATWFATVSHPAKPKGWDIRWGAQTDPRVVRLTGDSEITDGKVAGFLAKYATKSTEPVGPMVTRITEANLRTQVNPRTHQGRLILAALRLGHHPHEDFKALRRWAHMLGYRGHFSTKGRRYSTTLRALRAARRDWKRRQHPLPDRRDHNWDRTVVTRTDLSWAGRGWRSRGDALLALSAAARAREHRRIAREEMTAA